MGFRFNKMAPYPGEEDKEAIEWHILTKKDYERQ